jgi:1,4-dihydroxy-2-naphthoate octaprenyltransferase
MVFGLGNLAAATLALIGAMAIQVSANLANDYWDAKKGADGPDRLGPVRVTSAGLLSPKAVLSGLGVSMGLACLAGAGLVYRAGWPILVLGVLSLALALLYTAGPFPLAYLGLGGLIYVRLFRCRGDCWDILCPNTSASLACDRAWVYSRVLLCSLDCIEQSA